MSVIAGLWQEQKLPVNDGLYFIEGRSLRILLEFDGNPNIQDMEEFDLGAFYMDDPGRVTRIYQTKVERLKNGQHFGCGCGAFGADGWFALLDSDQNLLWVAFFEELNPFHAFTVAHDTVIVRSTSDVKIKVDLRNPMNMEIIS
jgi:hypothetical protein